MKKEDIHDYSKVIINLYLINNILLMQPRQSFSYEIKLNIFGMKYSSISALHDEYSLINNKNYDSSLAICIGQDIYSYLISFQLRN